jgi:hypothetical protein
VAARAAARHRGLFRLALAVATGALVAGVAIAVQSYLSTSGADGAVRGYFAALQRGDASAALAYGNVPAGPHDLLTSTVLAEQQRLAPLQNVDVISVAEHGNAASATVHYTLGFESGPRRFADTVTLHRSGGAWRLDRVAVPTRLVLDAAGQRATILGTAIPDTGTLLFPGAVPVRFDTDYLQFAPGTGRVGFTSPANTVLDVQLSPQGHTALAAALTDALHACLSGGGHPDPLCPLPSDRFVPGSLSGSVDAVAGHMRVQVSGPTGLLVVTGTVPFTGRYQQLDFDNLARAYSGTLQLPLSSQAYATRPLVPHWKAPT